MFDRIWKALTGQSEQSDKNSRQSGSASRSATEKAPAPVSQPTRQAQAPAGRDVLMDKTWGGGKVETVQPKQFAQVPANRASVPESRGGPALAKYAAPEVQRAEHINQQRAASERVAADFDRQLTGPDHMPTIVKEMSWDDYTALNPRQRAAVDLNTELVAAVNADKEESGPITDEYTQMVNKIFGEDRGSETAAPRTVALINELTSGGRMGTPADLDQFLNLSALVNANDLNYLTDEAVAQTRASLGHDTYKTVDGRSVSKTPLNPAQTQAERVEERWDGVNARAANARFLADGAQAQLANSLQAGQTLIQRIQANREIGPKLFGEPSPSVGFGLDERDQALQSMFDVMARKDATFQDEELQQALGSLEESFGLSNEQLGQFFETKLKAAEYSGKPIGSDSTATYLSPEEFRARFFGGK